MSKLISFVFLAFCFCFGHSQISSTESETEMSYSIIRSNLGISGSSNTITTNNGRYIVSQSIGQSSVIGTYINEGYTIRQGYQQPAISIDIIPLPSDNKLNAAIYPNPFQQIVTISFSELMTDDVSIIVFDINGRLILSQKHPPSQLIKLAFDDISSGTYLIKVSSNGKQFNAQLIKR